MATSKNKPYDITKSGPQSYRQLQIENAAKYKTIGEPTDPLFKKQLAELNAYKGITMFDPLDAATHNVQSNLYGTSTPLGKSAFDKETYNSFELEQASDIRAENEPWYVKAVNGILKGGVLAGTTFASGTLGLVAGLVQGTANAISEDPNKSFLDGLWDNPLNQALNTINELSEEWLPNYYTEEEQNSPWYNNIFTVNTIFDKVIKNIGFTVGAYYSGGVYAGAISKAANLIGAARALGKIGNGIKGLEEAQELGARAMQMSRAARSTKAAVGALLSAEGEGALEALNNTSDYVNVETQKIETQDAEGRRASLEKFISNGGELDEYGNPVPSNNKAYQDYAREITLLDSAKKQALDEIQATRSKMGTMDMLWNIPLLAGGNLFTFGKAWAGGWKGARNIQQTTTRATKEAAKAAKKEGEEAVKKLNDVVAKAKKTGYAGLTTEEKALVEEGTSHIFGPKMNATLAALGEPLKEGNEEMAQSAIAKGAHNYYSSKVDMIYNAALNQDSKEDVEKMWKESSSQISSLVQGFEEIYGDINNYEEGFIGALTGAFGSPSFGRRNNSTNQTYLGRNKSIGMTGGMISRWRDTYRERKNEQDVVNHVNSILKNGNLEKRLKHLVAQTTFNKDKTEAVIHNDKMLYKDSELAALFEDIMYLKEADKLDFLERIMATTEGFTEEDAKAIREMTTKTVAANGKIVTQHSNEQKQLISEIEELQNKISEGDKKTQDYLNSFNGRLDPKILEARKSWEVNREQLEKEIFLKQNRLEQVNQLLNDLKAKEVSPYMKEDGSVMSDSEVLAELKERSKKISTVIETVTKAMDSIDKSTEDTLTNDQLKTLTWYKVMMTDWRSRANDIGLNLKDYINYLDNPELKAAMEKVATEIENSPKDRELYGGLLASTRMFYSILENLNTTLEKLGDKDSDGGLKLALALNDDSELEFVDKEGKKTGKKQSVSDYLMEKLKISLSSSTLITDDEKRNALTMLEDLKKIGEGYNTYNKLLKEYMTNPEKIDVEHKKQEEEAEIEGTKKKAKKATEKVNFEGTKGELLSSLENNEEIENSGGIDTWRKTLTEEQQKKLEEAEDLQKDVDGLLQKIEASEEFSSSEKDQITKKIQELASKVDSIEELLDSLKQSGFVFEDTSDLSENEVEAVNRLEQQEAKLLKTLSEAEEDLKKGKSAKSKKSSKTTTKKTEEKSSKKKTSTTKKSSKKKTLKDVKKEKERKNTSKDTDPIKETSDLDEDKELVSNQGSINNVRDRRQRREKEGYTEGYSNRPQLSETFLFGFDNLSYVDYIEQNPDRIPEFIPAKELNGIKTREDFIKAYTQYIKATYEFLKNEGAFEYVKHKLKAGDELIFEKDEELSKKAGVAVVVMRAKDSEGNLHVVGTMKTDLDFMSVNKYAKDTYENLERDSKALYDKLKKGGKIITTVNKLMGGDASFSKHENTVFDIFEGTDTPIKLAVITDSGISETSLKVLHSAKFKSGQIYLLIEANNKNYLPVLCYSSDLNKVFKNKEDWYVQQCLNLFKSLSPSKVGSIKSKLSKWLGINSKALHINYGRKVDGKFEENDTDFDRIRLHVKNEAGEDFYREIAFKDSELPELSLYNALRDLVGFFKESPLTTNVILENLSSPSYVSNISKYLHTNVTQGETHTVNDWFTYKKTTTEVSSTKEEVIPNKLPKPSKKPAVKRTSSEKSDVKSSKSKTLKVGATTRSSSSKSVSLTETSKKNSLGTISSRKRNTSQPKEPAPQPPTMPQNKEEYYKDILLRIFEKLYSKTPSRTRTRLISEFFSLLNSYSNVPMYLEELKENLNRFLLQRRELKEKLQSKLPLIDKILAATADPGGRIIFMDTLHGIAVGYDSKATAKMEGFMSSLDNAILEDDKNLVYARLDARDRDILKSRGITEEDFNNRSYRDRVNLLECAPF